ISVVKNNLSEKGRTEGKLKKLKLSFKEQQEFEIIDDQIAAAQAQIDACEAEIVAAASDYIRLQVLMEQKEKLESDLELNTERWVYLNDLVDKINSDISAINK
ncbi:MAG: ABC transporter C-terminal domain-containing protein, partial [Oscillospiraceae bacterium]